MKELRKDGRWNPESNLFEPKRGLIASMIMRRPADLN
jgi:hypothetical protein